MDCTHDDPDRLTRLNLSPPHASPLVMRVLGACALAHLVNDLIQAVLPSIYPMLKADYGLTFTQVGLITLTFQLTASLLQPWIGYHTDRHPKPWLLPAGMVCTLVGILMLAFVGNFPAILLAAGLGVGSSTFHPERPASRAWPPAGAWPGAIDLPGRRQHRLAFGPLLAAAIIIPYGQGHVAWFGLFAVFAILVLYGLSRWYRNHLNLFKLKQGSQATHGLSKGRVTFALVVLALLVFSKYFYMASLTSYFTFYLIENSACRWPVPSCICSCSSAPWPRAPFSAGRSATGSGARR
jgi:FSR family fosmidomycin resistance protein-like MFS transporter